MHRKINQDEENIWFSYQICLTIWVVAESFAAVVTIDLPDQDEGKEYDDDEDDGDSDPHQDGGVVRVGGDGVRPWCLSKLV